MSTAPTDNPFRDFLDEAGELQLPSPPPWRPCRAELDDNSPLWAPAADDPKAVVDLENRARRHAFRDQEWELSVIRAALILRRPILITGKPGVGKSSLAYVTAHYLGLGPVLRWDVNSQSTVDRAIYRYDAVRRMEYYTIRDKTSPRRSKTKAGGDSPNPSPETAEQREAEEEGNFFRLGPVGTALLPRRIPRVLLIDEIDKSDLDLPDDLLHILEEGEYEIPELARLNLSCAVPVRTADRLPRHASLQDGRLQTHEFPLIFMTSNGERDFSSAFLRRCLRLKLDQPTKKELKEIVYKQLDGWTDSAGAPVSISEEELDAMAADFRKQMEDGKDVTTDQLLNTFFLRAKHQFGEKIADATAKDPAASDRAEPDRR